MSAPELAPGVWVEVIKSSGCYPEFTIGRLLCVEEVLSDGPCGACSAGACPGLWFQNMWRPHPGWASCCVRPIYRENPDIIEKLKQPIPEIVRDLIDA